MELPASFDIDIEEFEEKVSDAVDKEERNIAEDLAREYRNAVEDELSNADARSEANLSPLIDAITNIRTSSDGASFSVDHSSAAMHEYGVLSSELQKMEFREYAFGWGKREEVMETIPNKYFSSDAPFALPDLRYMRQARDRIIQENR